MSQGDHSLPDPSAALDDMCREAMKQQIAGQLEVANACYREILKQQPGHAVASHCLGMLMIQLQSPADGLPLLLTALQAAPQNSDYWLGYLEGLLQCGRRDEAVGTLRMAQKHGLEGPAVADFERRLAASNDLSVDQQEHTLRNLVKLHRFADALILARSITGRFPERSLAWKVLGAVLAAENPDDEALAALRRAAELLPDDAEAQTNIGLTLSKLQRFDEAENFLRRAVEASPGKLAPHVDLGNMFQMQGRIADAERCMRSAISLHSAHEPDDKLVYSSLLFALSHNPDVDAETLFTEHSNVGKYFEDAARVSRLQHANIADPERRLKIGFVSGDLCDHAVAYFIEPVLRSLYGRGSVAMYAYHTNPLEDGVSHRLSTYFEQWIRADALSDEQLTRRISADQIDILIDLSGHTARNRLRVFAAKPAPVQASWIGYPGTTGLQNMDYYLAERHFLPRDVFDSQFTEKLVHLPAGAAFQPHADAPPVAPLPALRTGRVNFGSFNRPGKINEACVVLWARVLRAVPTATMTVAGISADDRGHRINDWFAAQGIDVDRLRYHPRANMAAYLSLHHDVDMCLDTVPYSGGTTTYHAFWMGVPTLTIAGPTPASRQGSAIMGQLGLDAFVATDADDFTAKAIHWSGHLVELARLRAQLRTRWQQAPIRQIDALADGLENALRHMWRRWCSGLTPEFFEIFAPGSTT